MNKRYRGGDADCQSSNGDGIDESCAMLPSLFLISPAKVQSSNGNRVDYTFVAAAAAVAMIPIEALLVNQKEMLRILIMIISVRLERSTRVDGNNHGWQGASYMVSFFSFPLMRCPLRLPFCFSCSHWIIFAASRRKEGYTFSHPAALSASGCSFFFLAFAPMDDPNSPKRRYCAIAV